MPDETLPEIDEQAVIEPEIEAEEPSAEVVETDPLALLRAEFEAKLANPPWLKEIKTEVGRLRSIEARLEKAEDPSDRAALRNSLETKVSETEELIQSLIANLDDTSFIDPSVKTKAQQVIADRAKKAELDALEQRLRSELTPKAPTQEKVEGPQWLTETVREWEADWADRIKDENFDPDGAEFKPAWNEAGRIIERGGTLAEARQVMKTHLTTLKSERDEALKRQTAKRNAGEGAPRGTGTAVGPLDPSRPLAERAAHLRSLGIQVGVS